MQMSTLVYLTETKSEHQWLSEPALKYIVTFTFAHKIGQRHGKRHRKEGHVVIPT